jgi:ABC-type transport system involved in multi-copper enzyme maturation permease subunit
MKKILSIAHYTFIENIRNKVFYVIILFGVVIIGASVLLAALGGQNVSRILVDLGLGAIEFLALIIVIFSAVTLVLEEMESKTIYLVLSRPVSRHTYLIGRFAGLLGAVFCGMLLMSVIHVIILLLYKWHFTARYPLALFMSAGKIAVIGSLATFFAIFSTSAISAISFTVFFWILGHFSEELMFLSGKLGNAAFRIVFKSVYYLAPNLQYFNMRDFWDIPSIAPAWIWTAVGYAAVYCAFYLVLTLVMFSRKEF